MINVLFVKIQWTSVQSARTRRPMIVVKVNLEQAVQFMRMTPTNHI